MHTHTHTHTVQRRATLLKNKVGHAHTHSHARPHTHTHTHTHIKAKERSGTRQFDVSVVLTSLPDAVTSSQVIAIYNEHVTALENDLEEISTALTCIVSIKDYHEEAISHAVFKVQEGALRGVYSGVWGVLTCIVSIMDYHEEVHSSWVWGWVHSGTGCTQGQHEEKCTQSTRGVYSGCTLGSVVPAGWRRKKLKSV